jgi:hypothetical protein
VIIIQSLDTPKSILETEKTLKTLFCANTVYEKTPQSQKTQKEPKKPTELFFF